MGDSPLITPRDIVEAEQESLNVVFIADLFRLKDGLPEVTKKPNDNVQREDFHFGDVLSFSEQEDHNLRSWLNSLGLSRDVRNLTEDLRDGTLLLQIIHKAVPSSHALIDVKQLNKESGPSLFKRMEQCKYVLDIVHKLSGKVRVPTVDPLDLVEGRLNQTFALVNHIRRLAFADKTSSPSQMPKKRMAAVNSAQQMFRSARIKSTTQDEILLWTNKLLQSQLQVQKIEEVDVGTLAKLVIISLPQAKLDLSLLTNDNMTDVRFLLSSLWKLGINCNQRPSDFVRNPQQAVQAVLSSLLIYSTMHLPE
eukprot:TRINITY_DN3973_c0_g1_i1.p1 TRINITY_DN3973_c0_g1~~TRINITY_DN3973_c0_g1_i1.p1  ORF type:complete len:344 (+),score=87.73 TRINITY_DN3973_c0_g1_i1:111-1034(+)